MFEDKDSFRSLCPKCNRWYNITSQHICVHDDVDVYAARSRLKLWLKDYSQEKGT